MLKTSHGFHAAPGRAKHANDLQPADIQELRIPHWHVHCTWQAVSTVLLWGSKRRGSVVELLLMQAGLHGGGVVGSQRSLAWAVSSQLAGVRAVTLSAPGVMLAEWTPSELQASTHARAAHASALGPMPPALAEVAHVAQGCCACASRQFCMSAQLCSSA